MIIAANFWVFSRYPDLIHEYNRATIGTLTNRNLGTLSKDELINTHQNSLSQELLTSGNPWGEITASTLNWLYTNRKGMAFGILFGAALLNVVFPVIKIKKKLWACGVRGSLIGLVMGIPLGICANCVAPVGLSLRKRGMSLETTLATMIASPTLNIIGILITFIAFPFPLAAIKMISVLFLIVVCIPLLAAYLTSNKDAEQAPFGKVTFITESYLRAFKEVVIAYMFSVVTLCILTIPLMILAGIIGSALAIFFPLENFINPGNIFIIIIIASLVGTLLPIPMFVDLIFVAGLLSGGLAYAPAATLLFVLPTYSIFSMLIIGRYMSWRLAIFLYLIIVAIGILAGFITYMFYGDANELSIHKGTCKSIGKTIYTDITNETGIHASTLVSNKNNYRDTDNRYGGIAVADFGNTGREDLYFVTEDGGHLFQNLRNFHFRDITKVSGIKPFKNGTGALAFDYNNDGRVDLLLYGTGVHPILYENEGNFVFKDVTKQAGLENISFDESGAAVGDYNNDGWLDVYMTSYVSVINPGDRYSRFSNRLLENDHGVFKDVTEKSGLWTGNTYSLAAIFFDYNNDGWPDIFVANDFTLDELFINNKDGTFTNRSSLLHEDPRAKSSGYNSMGIAAADYDNSGNIDLFLTGIYKNKLKNKQGSRLLHHDGAKAFQDISVLAGVTNSGWSWGSVPVDYDNDGKTDIAAVSGYTQGIRYTATIGQWLTPSAMLPNFYLYRNSGNERFEAVSSCISGLTLNAGGRGLVSVDLNNDGYMDFAVNEWGGSPQIFQNMGGHNHWIKVILIGEQSNRMALGARVSVVTPTKKLMQEEQITGGYLSSIDPRLNFGLGDENTIKKIEVVWPSSKITDIYNVEADQIVTIKE